MKTALVVALAGAALTWRYLRFERALVERQAEFQEAAEREIQQWARDATNAVKQALERHA